MSLNIEKSNKNVINPGHPLAFIDSVHFLNNSLDNLVENLAKIFFFFYVKN